MGAAFGLTAYNLYEDSLAAESALSVLQQLDAERDKYTESSERPTGVTEEETISPDAPMPTILIDGKAYIGSLVIPAIGLELPVSQDWDYDQMKISPCRYSGSIYRDDLVICGHNYRTHFRNIEDLQTGDKVIFVDVMRNAVTYQVRTVETLEPTAVGDMVDSEYDLSLFTCNYAGNARVTVRCDRIEDAAAEKYGT